MIEINLITSNAVKDIIDYISWIRKQTNKDTLIIVPNTPNYEEALRTMNDPKVCFKKQMTRI